MVIQNKSESSFTDKIQDLVADAKKNIQWKRQYTDLEREKLYAYDAGLEQGAKETSVENAKNLLKMNVLTHEQVATAIGLSIEEVEELAKEI